MDTNERIDALNKKCSFDSGARELHAKLGLTVIDEQLTHGYPGNSYFLNNSLAAIAELINGLAENNEDVRKFLLSRDGVDDRQVDLAVSYMNKLFREG